MKGYILEFIGFNQKLLRNSYLELNNFHKGLSIAVDNLQEE
jgi:hypothetical protein